MAGLAQKGGAVYSHVRVGASGIDLHTPKIITGGADLLLACDAVVAAGPAGVDVLRKEQTAAVINSHRTPVAGFVLDKNIDFKDGAVRETLKKRTRPDATHFINATEIATALMGDSIATNLFVLGYAYQKGLIPLGAAAIERAIELNGGGVEANLKTFRSGRLAAHDEKSIEALLKPMFEATAPAPLSQSLDELIMRRAEFLTGYQNAAYAARYQALVEGVRAREAAVAPGKTALTEAVARYAFKLMAYKDEYEVARLYTDGSFEKHLKAQFEGDYKIEFNLAPPLLTKTDPKTGRPAKMTFGPWMMTAFKLLASLKGLRGTALDIFGYSHERRGERQLIADYEATVKTLLEGLTVANHALAVEIAKLPDDIRGYGPVKDANLKTVRAKWDSLLARFRNPATPERSAA